MKEIEFTRDSILSLAGFFERLGFSAYGRELRSAWRRYDLRVDSIAGVAFHKPDKFNDLHKKIKDSVTEYNEAYLSLIKVFDHHAKLISVVPPANVEAEQAKSCEELPV